MAKAFKKGDRVTVIHCWDGKGTVYVRHATVHSCGTKVLRLTCDVKGDEFGQGLTPAVAAPGTEGIRPMLDGEALAAEAQAVALTVVAYKRAGINRRMELSRAEGDERDVSYCQRELDKLAPNWITYEQGCQEVKERIAREYADRTPTA